MIIVNIIVVLHREVTSRGSMRENEDRKISSVDSEVAQMVWHGFDSITHNNRK